jgi:hypothetical protein
MDWKIYAERKFMVVLVVYDEPFSITIFLLTGKFTGN